MSEAVGTLKRRPLGRGLGALIPERPPPEPPPERRVLVADIRPNPRQPRRFFDEERIADLAESIRHQGVLQPLVVRKLEQGYELVIGERRLRAAQRAGLDRVPVVVKEVSDTDSLEMALVENIQREELTPIEEALAYRQLIEEFHLTQEEVATRVGKSRPVVTNLLRVLTLPEEIQQAIERGRVSVGHARVLLSLATAERQIEIARRIEHEGLSVRQTESLAAPLQATAKMSLRQRNGETPARTDLYVKALEEDLTRSLGTKVHLYPRKKGGKIEIEYYSNEQLDGLVGRLKG